MPSDLKAHYDPRIGDEDEEESPPSQARPAPPHIQVPGSPPEPGSSSTSASDEKLKHAAGKEKSSVLRSKGEEPQWKKVARAVISKIPLVNDLGWVKANFVFSKLKPVIRSSVSAWVAVVLLATNPVLRTMGQVRFYLDSNTRHTPRRAGEHRCRRYNGSAALVFSVAALVTSALQTRQLLDCQLVHAVFGIPIGGVHRADLSFFIRFG